MYFDGNSVIAQNGKLIQMSDMFDLNEVEVMIADVDI